MYLKLQSLNPGEGDVSLPRPDSSWDPTCILHNGYHIIPGGKTAEAWR